MSIRPHHEAVPAELEMQKDPVMSWVLKPRALNIVWGNEPRYWKMPFGKEDPAELLQVCWLEVAGSINDPQMVKGKTYEISFVVEMKEDAFGWSGCPIFIMAKAGKRGKYKWEKITLSDNKDDNRKRNKIDMRIEVENDNHDNTLYFGLYEVWSGRWKGGLLIYQAKVSQISSNYN